MAVWMLLILLASTVSAGCIGLVMQREILEGMREKPVFIMKEDGPEPWDVTFESDSLEAVSYTNETIIQFDETVAKLTIVFRAQFPYSSILEELVGNETNQYRYVEVRLWEPGVREAGGDPFWEVRATQDYPLERVEFSGNFFDGNWLVEIDALLLDEHADDAKAPLLRGDPQRGDALEGSIYVARGVVVGGLVDADALLGEQQPSGCLVLDTSDLKVRKINSD